MSEQNDLSRHTDFNWYNPLQVMVKLKMLKERHPSLPIVRDDIMGDFDKLELTQEFQDFAYLINPTASPDENMYTPYCIYKYLKYKCGINVGHEYKQDKSVTEEQIFDFFRILMFYFLIRCTNSQAVFYIMKHKDSNDFRDHIVDRFEDIRGIVYDLLFIGYDLSRMKKVE
jgi:hypothetical protein